MGVKFVFVLLFAFIFLSSCGNVPEMRESVPVSKEILISDKSGNSIREPDTRGTTLVYGVYETTVAVETEIFTHTESVTEMMSEAVTESIKNNVAKTEEFTTDNGDGVMVLHGDDGNIYRLDGNADTITVMSGSIDDERKVLHITEDNEDSAVFKDDDGVLYVLRKNDEGVLFILQKADTETTVVLR